jgi:cytochrome c553
VAKAKNVSAYHADPVAYRPGAPTLTTQNAGYILDQIEAFARGTRANDIDMPMRTIAALLTENERHAIAEFTGAGPDLIPGVRSSRRYEHPDSGICTC